MIVHYHDERSGMRGEASWPEIVGMVNAGTLSPAVLVHVNGAWITFAAANVPARPPKPNEASEIRELEELLGVKREWEIVDRFANRLVSDPASPLKEGLSAEIRAKLIMAARRGEEMDHALLRLRPDLDPSHTSSAGEVVKRRRGIRGVILRKVCRFLDHLSDHVAKLIP